MSQNLTNDFIDIEPVMDSIYGVIKISPFEKRLISTKEMQRLRGIKQLGFVNLVYPDAEHSRFAHSLGVCHQAKTIVDQVIKNVEGNEKFQKWRVQFINSEENKKLLQSNSKDVITPIERIVISAAALLHDLPHSPFSHEIETHNSDGKGIPVHDDFKNNPIFFRYLFDGEKSDLAKIISIYNDSFWQLVKGDKKWGPLIENISDIDDKGYVTVSSQDNNIQLSSAEKITSRKLPILGVMIFEILLFDKCEMWVDYKENKITPNKHGINVAINFAGEFISWKPIKNWFRPYRKDIVANTICADLLDYLLRDGRNTGILPALDLKFFDRMTIMKAYPDKTNTLIDLANLPDFCEHIVFDIFDHKRGVIRQSIITEILSFLQQRYLLAERVYQHRVVEGARTMLQEISRLLTETSSINVEQLHDINSNSFAPINDEAFFAWVTNINDNGKKELIKAKKLVKMLHERRIFREAVIIDSDHDSHKGTYRGNDVDCQTLANTLLDDTKRKAIIDKLNDEVTKFCEEKGIYGMPNYNDEQLFTIGVRKYGKGYKIPRVLVCKPLNNSDFNKIEVFPLFEAKKIPAMNDRLESMQKSYNSLWKVYLFVHPVFHQENFIEVHKKIEEVFLSNIYNETHIMWSNSIGSFKTLLPEKAIDIISFINDSTEEKTFGKKTNQFITRIFKQVNQSIGSIDFQLEIDAHKDGMRKKILKIDGGDELLKNQTLQTKVIKSLSGFKPQIEAQAAKDDKELVIDQIVKQIEKTLKTNAVDLFNKMDDK